MPLIGRNVAFISVAWILCLVTVVGGRETANATDASVIPNRTLPKFDPPRLGLNFSASPTEQEIFRARVFEEPLVPVENKPTPNENSDLAAALIGYSYRASQDDFASLTGFLEKHPGSPWAPSLLTGLGFEYYNTAHYSLALEAWDKAWTLTKDPQDANGMDVGGRAVGELAYMYARLGRMTELEPLLDSVKHRNFRGAAKGKIIGAREGLWTMHNRPQVAFRCGPLALHRIKLSLDPKHAGTDEIMKSASTQQGFSLPQVAELSKKIGLNYQMAFREKSGAFVVPSVIHWKVGHFAALVRKAGNLYLVQDPTFRNDVWATKEALEAEGSGYFLIPPGTLPSGWRAVETKEGASVWGKGFTSINDPGPITRRDIKKGGPTCAGMMVVGAHLMDVNLNLVDEPLGYTPPVGPRISFTVRYNSRDVSPFSLGPPGFGPQWSCDYFEYLVDNPSNSLADVTYQVGGGGFRTFTGFNTNTQTFGYEQYDQTLLTRTGPNSYQMLWPDGSRSIFGQSDGSIGTTRDIFLTQIIDPQGNAVTLTYDSNFQLMAITDAIGQVTTLGYGGGVISGQGVITNVTDPFGRSATFDYTSVITGYTYCQGNGCLNPGYTPIMGLALSKITDVIGLTSQVNYLQEIDLQGVDANNAVLGYYTDFVTNLITPYGTTTFIQDDALSSTNGATRYLETTYPDGSRDRVEFNQNAVVPDSDPPATVPQGMNTTDVFLSSRNTFYWSRNACATAYGDYSKARIYHWLHAEDLSSASGILESTKEPLEGRVWRDYAGQVGSYAVGSNSLPTHVGRVLDDGSTQLYTYAYNGFGHVTNSIDPVGRAFSYLYDTNGVDLLEIRQTRAGNNELLFKATYNAQHRPLTRIDAAGQTTTFTYNARGQLLTATDPKNETVTCTYDANGYLLIVDGPLPGTNDVVSFTYDPYGRIRTTTDVSGYTLTFDYDNLNRMTKIAHPDSTFEQVTYNRLDPVVLQDRAGRQTLLEYNTMRQMTKKTDPLGRVTLSEWCNCGALKSLTDPMGRMTAWLTDVQGRRIGKQYGDGSQVKYIYENTSSRVRQIIDEKLQATTFAYNLDNMFSAIGYANATVPTPGISYTYDPNYDRVTSMTDGTGTTLYSYNPIGATPALGAGRLASVDGPLTNDTITYGYDELGRLVHRAINGVDSAMTYDAAGRVIGATNALGTFAYAYDGSSDRLASQSFPNGQMAAMSYGNTLQDFTLQQISYAANATPVSQFVYGRDVSRGQITNWSQQAGVQPPSIFNFGYDPANQLLSATVTNAGTLLNTFAYGYDPAGNRLSEQVGASNSSSIYNALNQINTTTASGASRTNEWDAANRLVAVNVGNQRTEFAYDGNSRMVGIRQLLNGAEVSHRLFVWNGGRIGEERDTNGAVVKRFFGQGVQFVTGTNAGSFYYTRDHLGSVRELTDGSGNVRARYAYDPFGRRTKVSGDVDADFGFAGMFWSPEANLSVTHFRAYDPALGRWLSRDPLNNGEIKEGPNLYAYVGNEPINRIDPQGLCTDSVCAACRANPQACELVAGAAAGGGVIINEIQEAAPAVEPAVAEAGTCVQRVAEIFDTVASRTAALADYFRQAGPTLRNAYEDWLATRQLLSAQLANIPLWTVDMIRLDREFTELTELLVVRYGMTIDEARQFLVNNAGFDPDTWENW